MNNTLWMMMNRDMRSKI